VNVGIDLTHPPPLSTMPRNPSLRARLAALPDSPTVAELSPLARELAQSCAPERYPQKSLAATLRHARSFIHADTLAVLSDLARSELRKAPSSTSAAASIPAESFIGLAEASRRLNLAPKTLLDRLRETCYRRLYGWPWWDGHQWNFSPDALDPARRAQHLAVLPVHEPAAQVDLLPQWCEREPVTRDAVRSTALAASEE
jgi:hypothetical protein